MDIWKPKVLASLPATFLILPPPTHKFPLRPGQGPPLHIERFIEEKSKVFRDSLTNEVSFYLSMVMNMFTNHMGGLFNMVFKRKVQTLRVNVMFLIIEL